MSTDFQRARSPEAKLARENAILDAARSLATEGGIRGVTLTEVAEKVGMHKSALLRYFETREEIFLRLAAEGWHDWSTALRAQLAMLAPQGVEGSGKKGNPEAVAAIIASSLMARPLFCDLLAHVPMNLERNVSLETVRIFKRIALDEMAAISTVLRDSLPLTEAQAANVLTTAGGLAGALWQMAAMGTNLRHFYETEPDLAHAVVNAGPQLTDILTGLIEGYVARNH